MIDLTTSTWSLGTYFFWPLFIGGLALLAVCIGACFGPRDPELFVIGAIVAVITVGVSLFAYWPAFQPAYHKWHPTSGTVARIDSRLLNTDGGMTERFVVTFTQAPSNPVACDDTRCALLLPGQHADLRCKRQWQFQGTPGWVCAYLRTS